MYAFIDRATGLEKKKEIYIVVSGETDPEIFFK